MTMRYVHPAAEQKRVAMGKFETFSAEGIISAAIAEKSHGGSYRSHYNGDGELMSSGAKLLKRLVDVTGIEPATPCLQSRCSPS